MLAAANWREALQLLQAVDDSHAWQLRETHLGPYLALEGVPVAVHQEVDSSAAAGAAVTALLDYHVCYSHSYQVPTLLFRATSLDGLALGLPALQALFPTWPSASVEQLLGFVMPQEHPLLPSRPCGPCGSWLSLHPCNTATVLALTLGLGLGEGQGLELGQPPTRQDAAGAPTAGGAGTTAVTAGAAGTASPASASIPRTSGAAREPSQGPAAAVTAAAAAAAGVAGSHLCAAGGAAAAAPTALPADDFSGGGTAREVGDHEGSLEAASGCVDDDQTPDLDELLQAWSDAPESMAGQSGGGGVGQWGRRAPSGSDLGRSAAGGPVRAGEGRLGEMVGPSGVVWPGGEVPRCRGDARSLRRYMGAWLSLVGPLVGLERREWGSDAAAGRGL